MSQEIKEVTKEEIKNAMLVMEAPVTEEQENMVEEIMAEFLTSDMFKELAKKKGIPTEVVDAICLLSNKENEPLIQEVMAEEQENFMTSMIGGYEEDQD